MPFYYHITTARWRSCVLSRVMAVVVCFWAAGGARSHPTLTLILWVDKSEQQLQQISSSVWYLSALIKMRNSLRAPWSWGEKMLWDAGKCDSLNKNHAEGELYRRTAAEGAINAPALIPVLITTSEYIYISEYTVFSEFISNLRVCRDAISCLLRSWTDQPSSSLKWTRESSQDPLRRFGTRQSLRNAVGGGGKGRKARTQN